MLKDDRYGSLVFTGERINKNRRWLGVFDCDCGLKKTVRLDIVLSGNTKSCGCKSPNKDYKTIRISYGEEYKYWILFKYFRKNAKLRKKEFTITVEDVKKQYFAQNKVCQYTKSPLTFPETYLRLTDETTASIDRIDSSKGYIPGNIQLVTKKVNMMKGEMSHDEFIHTCQLIASNQGVPPQIPH